MEVEPNFGLSGKLAEESNTKNGVVLVYSEPPESRKPNKRRAATASCRPVSHSFHYSPGCPLFRPACCPHCLTHCPFARGAGGACTSSRAPSSSQIRSTSTGSPTICSAATARSQTSPRTTPPAAGSTPSSSSATSRRHETSLASAEAAGRSNRTSWRARRPAPLRLKPHGLAHQRSRDESAVDTCSSSRRTSIQRTGRS